MFLVLETFENMWANQETLFPQQNVSEFVGKHFCFLGQCFPRWANRETLIRNIMFPLFLLLLIIMSTLCAVPDSASMKYFSSFPVEFLIINSIHFFHRRLGILFRTQNQTKAFFVTVPPLTAVHFGPQ